YAESPGAWARRPGVVHDLDVAVLPARRGGRGVGGRRPAPPPAPGARRSPGPRPHPLAGGRAGRGPGTPGRRAPGAPPRAAGAPPEAIVRVAIAHGLSASKREHMTVDDLAAEIDRGHPVIVELQAWSDAPRTSWTDDWDDGHYAIAVAVEGDRVIFEDPSVLGSRSV